MLFYWPTQWEECLLNEPSWRLTMSSIQSEPSFPFALPSGTRLRDFCSSVRPVVLFDHQLGTIYQEIKDFWNNHLDSSGISWFGMIVHVLGDISVLSIAGGIRFDRPANSTHKLIRDRLVRSELSVLEDRPSVVSVISTSIPSVWVGLDHLSSLWCMALTPPWDSPLGNQFASKIVEALALIIDPKTKQSTLTSQAQTQVFRSTFCR